MILSIVNGASITSVDVPDSLTLGDLKTLIASELSIAKDVLVLSARGGALTEHRKTLANLGLKDHDVVTVRTYTQTVQRWPQSPALATIDNAANGTALDPAVQARIEQAIVQQNILHNLSTALDEHPESFAPVPMLYVELAVNGVPVRAFVDTGAQATIMTLACAERCGFAGVAKGIGTGAIIGRVHSAIIRILGTSLHLPSSFTVLEDGDGPEMLLGLDLLRRYQAVIDLKNGVLVIEGQRVAFVHDTEQQQQHTKEDAGK